MTSGVLIVGGGQGGFQLAASLRQLGYPGPVTLVGDEPHAPYNRPPLSKAFLKGCDDAGTLALRPASFYAGNQIDLVTGERIVALDRLVRRAVAASGRSWGYDHCVLATGARNRRLDVPGSDLACVHHIRDVAGATALRASLSRGGRAVIVGGGFIGLEVAAVARTLGLAVDVVEATGAPMGRVVSIEVARAFAGYHERAGVTFHFGRTVSMIEGDRAVTGVRLSDGATLPADLALVAIGVEPNTDLAERAGLTVANGIVVDATLATEDPRVSAMGDCAVFPDPFGHAMVRLESVQNAVDHARCIAARLTGDAKPYSALPWFWSEQGTWKLQIAGYGEGCTTALAQPDGDTFSVFRFRDGVLRAIESVNRPADHILARRVLAGMRPIGDSDVRAAGLDVRSL